MLAVLVLAAGLPSASLRAQSTNSQATASTNSGDERQIVVIGSRTIIAELKDVEVERSYDADAIASYAFSTVDEVIEQLAQDNGDTDPSLLVNGQRVAGVNDIGDYPVEAIERIEVLPPGTASRIGGTPGQRAYNVVLKRQFRSLALNGSRQITTEGGWSNNRGDASVSLIRGQDRINLSYRLADSGMLLERSRNVVPLPQSAPFAQLGNLLPLSGTEIDPALSQLVGSPVTTVALDRFAARPSLTQLATGANRLNPDNLSDYRSIRGSNRTNDLSLAGSKQLAPWLTVALNGRLNWSNNSSLSGLPSARIQIPAANSFNPFGHTVQVAVNDPTRPLRGVSKNEGRGLTGTFNINSGDWRVTLVARADWRERTYSFDQVVTPSGGYVLDAATNPFTGALGSLIETSRRLTRTNILTRELSEDAEGPLLRLPAGPMRLRIGVGAIWSSLDAVDSTGISNSSFRRRDFTLRGGVTFPLTAPDSKVLPGLGTSELSVDFGKTAMGRYGKLDRQAYVLNWQPVKGLRLTGSRTVEGRAIAPELIAAPSQEYDNVRFFDPLRNEMAVVTAIYGGAANLRNESWRIDRLTLSTSPFPRNLLQFNVDYVATLVRNPIGALPPPSAAVVDAFPDRFVRDATGQLIRVDGRTVNFDQQYSRELRTTLDLIVPLFGKPTVQPKPVKTARPGPLARPTLRVHAAHVWLMRNVTTIRAGLPSINLLDGGAIGLGGGRPRHMVDGSVDLASGGTGLRFEARWYGSSKLRVGTVTAPDLLDFKPYAQFNAKAFADLGALFPKAAFAKGGRISISVENLANRRQDVRNSLGQVPTSFQPAIRDPLGRTMTVELRKTF